MIQHPHTPMQVNAKGDVIAFRRPRANSAVDRSLWVIPVEQVNDILDYDPQIAFTSLLRREVKSICLQMSGFNRRNGFVVQPDPEQQPSREHPSDSLERKIKRSRVCVDCDHYGPEPFPSCCGQRIVELTLGRQLKICSRFLTAEDYWLEVSKADGRCPKGHWQNGST